MDPLSAFRLWASASATPGGQAGLFLRPPRGADDRRRAAGLFVSFWAAPGPEAQHTQHLDGQGGGLPLWRRQCVLYIHLKDHRCPSSFWLFCLSSRGPWFTWRSIYQGHLFAPKGHLRMSRAHGQATDACEPGSYEGAVQVRHSVRRGLGPSIGARSCRASAAVADTQIPSVQLVTRGE